MSNDNYGRNFLAMERTKLANERTFLAYFRSFAVLLSSGLAIIKIDALQNLTSLGYVFLSLAVIIISIGAVRFFSVRRLLEKTLVVNKE